jgi:hypothetical protein
MEDNLKYLKMEDDLNLFKWKTTSYLKNGRQPQYFEKLKMTSIFWKMEDDLLFILTSIYLRMEDDFKKIYIYI